MKLILKDKTARELGLQNPKEVLEAIGRDTATVLVEGCQSNGENISVSVERDNALRWLECHAGVIE